MRRLVLGILATNLFLAPLGCGGSDSPTSVSKDQFSSTLTHAACDAAANCCKAPRTFDAAGCNMAATRVFAEALGDPLARYDAAEAGKCIDATRSAAKACQIFSTATPPGFLELALPAACDHVFSGTAPPGAACRGAWDCAPSNEGPGLCVNGVCVQLVRGHKGDGCDCEAKSGRTICYNPQFAGAPASNTIANCHAEDGLTCTDMNDGALTPSCQQIGEIGAACWSNGLATGTPCVDGAYCEFNAVSGGGDSATCAARLPLGKSCTSSDACADDAYCDSLLGCATRKTAGAACRDDSECASSSCNAGICAEDGPPGAACIAPGGP
jgi:hypothetical protein